MTPPPSKFALLLELARETSSEKRRELLREIADLLAGNADIRTADNCASFDEIAVAVIADLKAEARAEISRMIAAAPLPLGRIARQLAMDDVKVARDVLEHSVALTENDLVDVADTQSQEHLLAVTRRVSLGERVSEAIVARGEDRVVASLLVNKGAQMGRETYERVAERAQESPVLHEPFVRRQGVPLDLLNDLYVSVAASYGRRS